MVKVNTEGRDENGVNQYDVIYNKSEYESGNTAYNTGNNNDGIKIDKSVMKSKRAPMIPFEVGPDMKLTNYRVKGDENATNVLLWLDLNTDVEWTVTRIGDKYGDQGKNLLSTLHEPKTAAGRSFAVRTGYTVRSSAHIHPEVYSYEPSDADYRNHIEMTSKFPNSKSYILHKGIFFEYTYRPRTVSVEFK